MGMVTNPSSASSLSFANSSSTPSGASSSTPSSAQSALITIPLSFTSKRSPVRAANPSTRIKAKSLPCAGCGQLLPRRELVELMEGEHDGLTFFDGDLVCQSCLLQHGVIYSALQ